MDIGVPAEVKTAERRVGLTPAAVGELVNRGHHVNVETAAGDGAGFSDVEYKEAGAAIVGTADYVFALSLIHISQPTRPERLSYAVFCLKKKRLLLLDNNNIARRKK